MADHEKEKEVMLIVVDIEDIGEEYGPYRFQGLGAMQLEAVAAINKLNDAADHNLNMWESVEGKAPKPAYDLYSAASIAATLFEKLKQ